MPCELIRFPLYAAELTTFRLAWSRRSTRSTIPSRTGPLEPRQVLFKRSGKTATWTPEAGSLLDFAEALGLELPYSCRMGMCGKCVQEVKRGEIAKIRKTVARIRPGQELLCSSVPISDLEIDL
jgi:ferredoxin